MNEAEFRDLLCSKASEFSMTRALSADAIRRAWRRAAVRGLGATALLVGSIAFTAMHLSSPVDSKAPAGTAVKLDLADFYEDEDHHTEAPQAHEISRADLERQVACMREHGFDLPAPTRIRGEWTIYVDDPKPLGIGTERWREAAFVDCRPPLPPGPGDLVMGVLAGDDIEPFRSCMAKEGFPLPLPRRSNEGDWIFNTSDTKIDFADDTWNRSLFVTCWPSEADSSP